MDEHRFPAMGTTVHLVVVAGEQAHLRLARSVIETAEARWSRFLPDSEITALNASPGVPVLVSPETLGLISYACDAAAATAGRFDPTVHDALVALGYDRSFDNLPAAPPARPAVPAPGTDGVTVDADTGCITLQPGTRLDLGGVAKGHTADLVVAALIEAGVGGCCVNIGGDLRVSGRAPTAEGWRVELACPGAEERLMVTLLEGAVCTSTTLRRAWHAGGQPVHHLVDPATGRPTASGVASATVIARTGAQAEILTKVAVLAGPVDAPAILAERGATGVLVADDGVVHRLDGLEPFLVRCSLAGVPIR